MMILAMDNLVVALKGDGVKSNL